jgi:hypothetical protein
LPEDLIMIQECYGLEGIVYYPDEILVVCLHRAWGDYDGPLIGMYDLQTKDWEFGVYPLSHPDSQNDGWVDLSDITYVEGKTFYILERGNQGLLNATIKRMYSIELDAVLGSSGDGYLSIAKTLVKDLAAARGPL